MNRREFVTGVGCLAAFAGCNSPVLDGSRSPPDRRQATVEPTSGELIGGVSSTETGSYTETSATPTATSTISSTPPATTSASTATPVRRRYDTGTLYHGQIWSFGVTSIDFYRSFTLDDRSRQYSTPANEQLAIASVTLRNNGNGTRGWISGFFSLTTQQRSFEPQNRFDHPQFEEERLISRLEMVEHARQFQTSGNGVPGGESGTIWLVATVPRTIVEEELRVVYDAERDSGGDLRLTWSSESS